MTMSLIISNLHVSIGHKKILQGLSLKVRAGEVHAVMGPNGSGKSTLAYTLMGYPAYTTHGKIQIDKKNISQYETEERAKAGLFLALQSPVSVPGVSVTNLLRTSYEELYGGTKKPTQNPVFNQKNIGSMTIGTFIRMVKQYAKELHLDESLLSRSIHDGFSGGEKKKIEMLTALVLSPSFAIFDEIDTGLDVDALKIVANGIRVLVKKGTGVIIITHYRRILKYVHPDIVHVLVNGKIVKTGKADLAVKIEEDGYADYQ
jgi:Fe-S cluster assembly ATP-binding protein